MTMTYEASQLIEQREQVLSTEELSLIYEVFTSMFESAKHYAIALKGDDRLAMLEAALIKYLIDCKEGN